METSENTGKRAVWYIVGLNLIAATVVLNIRYNIGVAAFSSVMYAISEIYRISLGTASIICYLIFVMMQCILSRRITLIYLLEIPLSFAFGVLTDVYDWLIPALPFALPTRLLCFTLTMFVTSAGVFLCVKSKMVLTPTDGIVNTISEVFHLRFSTVKNSFDLFYGCDQRPAVYLNHSAFYGIGVGTVLSALMLGRIIKLYEVLWRVKA